MPNKTAVPLTVSDMDYFYGEGEDLLFDDVFPHRVRNDGPLRRVSLIMDVHRNFGNIFVDFFNSILLWALQYNPTVVEISKNIDNISPIVRQ